MNRKQVIREIMGKVQDKDIVVSSTGLNSRELYALEDRKLNFYMMGSMGNALAIGLGMALNTNRKVFVINGDASALMSLGTMATHTKLNPSNLEHYILDNNQHESTGGQPTASTGINFERLAPNTKVYKIAPSPRVPPRIKLTGEEMKNRFEDELKKEPLPTPIASIIIPSFQRSELLDWGLSSLAKQECPYPFEILILNDGLENDDATQAVCKKYSKQLNIRYIFTGQRNKEKVQWRCPGFPLNIGVKKAYANYIILSCPEIYHLDKHSIKKVIDRLKTSRRIMVRQIGWDDQKNEYLAHVKKTNGNVDTAYPINGMVPLDTKLPFFLGIHKEEFLNIGGYDEDFIGWAYDDTDLIARMQKYGISYELTDSNIVHLYHPRHRQGIEETQKMYQHNKKLYYSKLKSGVVYSNKNREWGVFNRRFITDYIEDLWKLKNIPKVAHFYWGNEKLPYLRYLSVLSFKIHNPAWKIKFYVPPTAYKGQCWDTSSKFQFTGQDYFPNLKTISNVEIIKADFGFIDNICEGLAQNHLSRAEVYRSDFLRWHLLATEGGLWSDMDIMYFKPIHKINVNINANQEATTLISLHPVYKHSVGFMLSSPNNPYYAYILQKAKENFHPEHYQSIGVTLLNKDFGTVEQIENKFPVLKGTVKNIDIKTVYAYDAQRIPTIYNYPNMASYNINSIGLHWYAGHNLASKFINKITHLNYGTCRNVLGRTIGLVYGGK